MTLRNGPNRRSSLGTLAAVGSCWLVLAAFASAAHAGSGALVAGALGCDPSEAGASRVARVELTSRIILAARFLSGTTPAAIEADLRRAIALQQRFVIGYLKNDTDVLAQTSAMVGAPIGQPVLRSVTKGEYPAALEIDTIARFPAAGQDPYVQAALRAGRTRAKEPAWIADYQWMAPITLCRGTLAGMDRLDITVPLDPFLAFWQVGADARRLQYWAGFWAVINPCLTAEGAELAHPQTLWYTWAPRNRLIDQRGRDYRCTDHSIVKQQVARVGVEMLRAGMAPETSRVLSRKRGPRESLRLTFVAGNLTRKEFKQIDAEILRADFKRATSGGTMPSPMWENAFSKLAPGVKPTASLFYEPGAREFLTFLKYLPGFVNIDKMTTETVPDTAKSDFLGTITGTLKRSRQPIQVHVFYGDTVPWRTVGNPLHHRVLLDALLTSDIVVYAGHAGLGVTHRLDSLLQGAGMTRKEFVQKSRKRPELLSVALACESFSYFGEDLAAARAEAGVATETMLSAHKDVGAKYILGLLEAFERYQTGEKTELSPLLSRYTPPGEYLVFTAREP